MKTSNKKIIILIGAPGSGKDTQAELLAGKLNLFNLETSEVIERNLANATKGDFVIVKGKKYFLSDEKRLRETGKLMSPPVITVWIKNKMKELAKEGKGIVTSGSPRTLYEGKELIPFLKKVYGPKNIKIILIKVSEKETIWRNTHRKTCELMRHTILYSKATSRLKNCPFDGSKLILRKYDNPAVIKVRIKEYEERTIPLMDYFKKEKLIIKKIDGSPTPAIVFENILKALK
jgi:adenylate kinase